MRWLPCLLITFHSIPLAPAWTRRLWIVWNVGQGLWITALDEDGCRHFDAGGERLPLRLLAPLCAGRRQQIYLSHGDWDHIGGLPWLRRQTPRPCLVAAPRVVPPNRRKIRLWRDLPRCSEDPKVIAVYGGDGRGNAASRVYRYEGFLMPGDSPMVSENRWLLHPALADTQVLVLGHHGSRTSTSRNLLARLPRLTTAIASARWRRYGHPHPQVTRRLRERSIARLDTEIWGHLVFETASHPPSDSP